MAMGVIVAARRVGVALGLLALLSCADAERAVAPDAAAVAAQDAVELDRKTAEVTKALLALGPSVDPDEAERAARVAVRDPLDWAKAWRMTDPPLIHNFKVVHGLREKGVCQDFADAMHRALQAEGFRSLQIHRALANARNLRLEHTTVVLTARGQPMEQGVILDPWRLGQGRLWFGRVSADDRFAWETPEAARAWRMQRDDEAPGG